MRSREKRQKDRLYVFKKGICDMNKRMGKYLGIACVALLLVIVVVCVLRKPSLLDAYKNDLPALGKLPHSLFAITDETKAIYIRKGGDYTKLEDNLRAEIEDFFSSVRCNQIYVSWTRASETQPRIRFCDFYYETRTSISGLVYVPGGIPDTADPRDVAAADTPMIDWLPLSDEWFYFECVSYEDYEKSMRH